MQGIINVNVPVRATIIRLIGGGLFVNNPVAPTPECIEYMRRLEAEHGDVKYIVLSSLAIEHKGTSGIFSSYFKQSVVYVQPGQYAFPIDLPTFFFYPLGKTIKEIPLNNADAPWSEEIDHQVLGPLRPPGTVSVKISCTTNFHFFVSDFKKSVHMKAILLLIQKIYQLHNM